MTQDSLTIEKPTTPRFDQDLFVSALMAARAAMETDLPDVMGLFLPETAMNDLDQSVRRDLYAAKRYGIHFGCPRPLYRRPECNEIKTFVIPSVGGNLIVVFCVDGSAAVCQASDRRATLLYCVPRVGFEFLQQCADGLPHACGD
jgi:hypothetical protein